MQKTHNYADIARLIILFLRDNARGQNNAKAEKFIIEHLAECGYPNVGNMTLSDIFNELRLGKSWAKNRIIKGFDINDNAFSFELLDYPSDFICAHNKGRFLPQSIDELTDYAKQRENLGYSIIQCADEAKEAIKRLNFARIEKAQKKAAANQTNKNNRVQGVLFG